MSSQARDKDSSLFQPNVLRATRHSHFLTQEELARELDVTVKTVARWEQGVVEPSFRKVRKLADFFAVPPGDFYAADEAAA